MLCYKNVFITMMQKMLHILELIPCSVVPSSTKLKKLKVRCLGSHFAEITEMQ